MSNEELRKLFARYGYFTLDSISMLFYYIFKED